MNINEAAEHLRRLAQSNPHRSKTGCLRELYVEIEAARKAGFTTEKIVDALNEKGLDISLGTFVTLLHRIRKQLGHVATVSAGDPPNRRARPKEPKEPNPASQDVVNSLDVKDGEPKAAEQSAVVDAQARGVRKTKKKEPTAREKIAADMAKYDAEQAALLIPIKK